MDTGNRPWIPRRRRIVCPVCGHDGPYFIVEITDDYVVIECPSCRFEQGLCVGSDLGK
jgi:hypothetical protein